MNMQELCFPCRLCSELSNPTTDHVFKSENEDLVSKIKIYLSIQITPEDTLSTNICESCKLTLRAFDEFASICAAVQVQLAAAAGSDPLNNLIDKIKCENVDDDTRQIKEECESVKSEDETFYDDNNINDMTKDTFEAIIPRTQTKVREENKIIKAIYQMKKVHKNLEESFLESKIVGEDSKKSNKNIKNNKVKRKKNKSTIDNSFLEFTCHKCPKHFNTWGALVKHTKDAHSTLPRILCLCGKFLSSKTALYVHIQKHDKSLGGKCQICKRSFVTEQKYKQHMSSHESESPKSYCCSKCNKKFPCSAALKAHLQYHKRKDGNLLFSCDICDLKFISKYNVSQHIRIFHDHIKNFMCDVCGNSFNSKGALKGHEITHVTERLHQCPECAKSFKSNFCLKRHLNVHNEKKYKCEICDSKFNDKSTLNVHGAVHQDVFKYKCSFCNKGFKWKPSFTTHINNHTGNTPYKCPWCPRKFADGPNCRIHKKRKHPVQLAEHEARSKTGTWNLRAAIESKTLVQSSGFILDRTVYSSSAYLGWYSESSPSPRE